MKKLEEILQETYTNDEKQDLEVTLSAAKDALESHGGRAANIEAVVGVLLDALEHDTDPEVVEWTLDALVGATFHPDFAMLDLTRLVKFLQGGRTEWLATGLEILAGTSAGSHLLFISSLTDHQDPKIAANAIDALSEIQSRQVHSG